MDVLSLIGRTENLFANDISNSGADLTEIINASSFLVLGGGGSIGQAVVKQIFKRAPKKLHVVDISENNLVELVRDIRSSLGYIEGEFMTFALDIGSREYDVFYDASGPYDFVLNLSALKHVRSERDPYTLMRMLDVNVFNAKKTIEQAMLSGVKKYFCVSTDKAANPVNMMGATKRIMEMFVMRHSSELAVSTARFANVAFSDGSLLHSFNQRIMKKQPIAAPDDVRRYFITAQESGELGLMSCIFGDTREIFFPKLNQNLHLITFSEIASRYLDALGYEPYLCESEEEARSAMTSVPASGKWPCFFSASNTTGEKPFEEFYMEGELLDMTRFENIGIVKSELPVEFNKLDLFESEVVDMKRGANWNKGRIVELFHDLIPEFYHNEKSKYLDSKM